jgi:hypothetical protein
MKKVLLLLSAIVLVSCSGDDGSSPATGALLKKIVQTYNDGEPHTAIYHYNGNKVTYISTEDDKLVYTYSGDKITDISVQDLSGNEWVHFDFAYDNAGRLSHQSVTYIGPDIENYSDYTYNADGTVSVVQHLWHQFEGQYIVENRKLFFTGNDLDSVVTYLQNGTSTVSYSYDDSKNPYRNIEGFDKLLTFDASQHNATSETATGPDGSIINQAFSVFDVNVDNYPETSTRTENGDIRTTQYFYQ